MGLGLLFSGYITLLTFKVLPPVLVVGAYLMYAALKKLSIYGKDFVNAKISAVVFGIYCAAYSALQIADAALLKNSVLGNGIFAFCESIAYTALLVYLNTMIIKAVTGLCKYCGYEKGIKRANFAKTLMATFAVFAIISAVMTKLGIKSYLPLAQLIAQTAWLLYTAVFLYGCYMHIATDEMIEQDEKAEKERIRKLSEKAAGKNKGGK